MKLFKSFYTYMYACARACEYESEMSGYRGHVCACVCVCFTLFNKYKNIITFAILQAFMSSKERF